ncbi:MAG: thioredoxin domain-containing protein [Candidatus Dadabacteria bacterium]|nr:MAG: thioredoxin domain-containing protein [Candidatus Dadabacteria bacterium]
MTARRLADEPSLYLQQHADQPVDWYPWGEAALSRAAERDVPILISSGYATCHWCHVMAHECFEDAEVADWINRHFVPIKIDREELPHIDAQYMAALLAIQGHGGWPLTVFALPDGRPFFAGTYFPKHARNGHPGFLELLQRIVDAWRNDRDRLEQDAARITEAVRTRSRLPEPRDVADDQAAQVLMMSLQRVDSQWGGLGDAPKFPPHAALRFWQSHGDAPAAREALEHTLAALLWRGLRDQVGGAWHRYCVDRAWIVPHFEQMLYDNAQLIDVLAQQVLDTQRPGDRFVLTQATVTLLMDWVTSEGWLAAGWDADDPCGEGHYYTWTPDELRAALLDDADWAIEFFQVEANGPVDGRCTLVPRADPFDPRQATSEDADQYRHAVRVLAAERHGRPAPARDDKGIVADNGLALRALARAVLAVGSGLAERVTPLAHLLRERAEKSLPRAWFTDDQTRGRAGLDDVAALGLGLLHWGLIEDAPEFVRTSRQLLEQARLSFFRGGRWHVAQDDDFVLGTPAGVWDQQTVAPMVLLGEWLLTFAALTGDDADTDTWLAFRHQVSGAMAAAPLGTLDLWRLARLADRGLRVVSLTGQADGWFARAASRTPVDVLWLRPRVAAELGRQDLAGDEARAIICRGTVCEAPCEQPGALLERLRPSDSSGS